MTWRHHRAPRIPALILAWLLEELGKACLRARDVLAKKDRA